MSKMKAEISHNVKKARPQTSSIFDEVRGQRHKNSQFVSPPEENNEGLSHAKSVANTKLAATYQSISKSLARLHELGERNWSFLDFGRGPKIRTTIIDNSAISGSQFFMRTPQGSKNIKRFFPYESQYAKSSEKNKKMTSKSNHKSSNYTAFKVCGKHCNTINQKPFDLHPRSEIKPYTTSAETVPKGWAPRTCLSTSSNFESSQFNIINHSQGNSNSIPKMIKSNPWAFHRAKGITEYLDLGRRTATQPNRLYNEKLKKSPHCFSINSGFCSRHFDIAFSYGPFYKPFGKQQPLEILTFI